MTHFQYHNLLGRQTSLGGARSQAVANVIVRPLSVGLRFGSVASQIVCEDTAAQPVVRARSPPSGSALVQTLVLLLGLRRGAVTSIAAAGRA